MTDIQREESLSAYLDGETSPEERARVEGWLAESPELRQLHDDLLALRAGMQSLPRHKLERELSSSIIRRAAPAVSRPAGGDSGVSKVVPGSTSLWERGSNVRRLLWPALAVAAALAILIFDANQRPDEQQVAQAPREAGVELESQSGDVSGIDANIGAAPDAPAAALAREESPSVGLPAVDAEQASPGVARSAPTARPVRDGESPAARPAPGDFAKRAPQTTANKSGRESILRGGPAEMQKAAPPANDRQLKSSAGYSQSTAGAKADAQPTFVYSVSEDYLKGKEFEKLLDANRISWEQLPDPVEMLFDEAKAEASDAAKPPTSLGRLPTQQQSLYLLRATSSQVNSVLSKVPQRARLVEENRAVLPRFTAPQKKRDDESEPGVQVLLVSPQQAAPATVPAQPAIPAQQKR